MKILIINSKNQWINGWAVNPKALETVVNILQKGGFSVNFVEVSSVKELQKVLEKADVNTLVWANAYWVNDDWGQNSDLISWIEKYQLPLIGSSSLTLQQLLHKDTCQVELQKAGIPVPSHVIIKKDEVANSKQLIKASKLNFPAVVKPTKESRSNGAARVNGIDEAVRIVETIFKKYSDNNVIIEDFLPGDDVTCGYFQLGDKKMLLPSYCAIEGLDCKNGIYSEYHYTLPHTIESHPKIEDVSIINQLKKYIPSIVDLFDIQCNTRIDGRLDKNGILNFFDVNGMPGLNFPSSAIIKQVVTHFPKYDREFLFKCLIHTIIGDSFLRYNWQMPSIIQEQNLFHLESSSSINVSQYDLKDNLNQQ